MTYDEAMQGCIFRYLAGSHAYGTNGPESDLDYRGVFIAPLVKAFELFQTSFVGAGTLAHNLKAALESVREGNNNAAEEQIRAAMDTEQGDLSLSVGTVHKPGTDEELQELRKFMKLASDSNPNIIEFLWVDRLITNETDAWKRIKENRHLFLSKKARWTFSGYAVSQLNRIKVHRRYLLNPPKKKPERKDFGLPGDSKVPAKHRTAVLSLPPSYLPENIREQVAMEIKYDQAMEDWAAYVRWSKERNPARREMEAKWGYDVKHAMHLVRLVRMAKEILSHGEVLVYRPDREELLEIRNGKWSYEKLVEYADNTDKDLDALYSKSLLRNAPDHNGISKLYIKICEDSYGVKIS